MIGADELLGRAAELAAILGRTVPATVLEHVDRAILGSCDDNRSRSHVRADEIAGVGQLGFERHVVPGAAVEYSFHLTVIDVPIGIDPVRDAREVVPRPHILSREEDAVIARVASAIRASPGPLAIGRLGRHAGWRSFGCRLYRIAGLSRPLQI